MRFGRLLAEDAPSALIQTYGQASLESVFLTLCMDNSDTDEESRDRSKKNSIELENIVSRENNEVDNIVEAKPGAAPTNLLQSPPLLGYSASKRICATTSSSCGEYVLSW